MEDGNQQRKAVRSLLIVVQQMIDVVAGVFGKLMAEVIDTVMPEEGDFVRVMSLHKSKGLTSRVTIVAGCIQGLIPFQDDDEPPAEQAAILREQRRLFYVAITRCTEMLVLPSAVRMERQLAWTIGARL